MAKCDICDKSVNYGNKLSITFKPNIRTVKAMVDGQPKKINVCTKCLRSGKVTKA